ncbi:uncharacterized protein LOC132197120 [Neocloeon triangulifer]|uniref:uncharacterized protein LOC132197120 n=1 Tax=Neocloeon triangulifer TaxID=2078957 RepID=UPI00286F51A6|nr:uncharacterized protein LOC132197120 [Neocloeon triangulifer]
MDRALSLSPDNQLSVLVKFGLMSWSNQTSSACLDNCSGHGECHNGTCVCEIQYEGEVCRTPNFSYHAAFASIFFFLALVCLIQLVMCIAAEFQKMKTPSLWRACRITTQKLLYFLVFLATIIRGAYFTSPNTEDENGWPRTMMSAFYPLLLSGSSLIVCFWAEVFHLQDVRCERPQFLSKSFLGFVIFNIISYFFLIIELVTTTKIAPTAEARNFYVHVFNGCYAVLLFIVVVFFLIYGVEVYFKVRGGFICEHEASVAMTLANNRWTNRGSDKQSPKVKASTSKEEDGASSSRLLNRNQEQMNRKINTSQLHQSRLGLVSQAIMLFIVVGFLFSETLSEFWKSKVPLVSRNWHDILFHIVEIGAVLWFPCVLWNCISPEQLWILNPKKLLMKIEADFSSSTADKDKSPETDSDESDREDSPDCWICYDPDRKDAGPLIKPCQCRGDVSNVHHNCLRRWLVESALDDPKASASDKLKCKVCGSAYQVEQSTHLDWQQGFTLHHWLQTSAIVTAMCISVAVAWVLVQFFTEPFIRLLAIGGALLVCYIGIRFLGLNTATAYERARVSALSIVGQTPSQSPTSSVSSNLAVNTISETITVNLQSASSALLSSKQ